MVRIHRYLAFSLKDAGKIPTLLLRVLFLSFHEISVFFSDIRVLIS
jgi:hypothetical protein